MAMLPNFADIARRVILSPHRRRCEIVDIESPLTELNSREGFLPEFRYHLASVYPQIQLNVIERLLVEFFTKYPTLVNWYDAVLLEAGLEIRFEGGEPLVRESSEVRSYAASEQWMDLAAEIDADALIALQFAGVFQRRAQEGELRNWGVFARIDCREILDQPMWRRLRDIHTHLSACENAPLLWSELLAGQIDVERLPAYDDRNDQVFGPWADRREEGAELRRVLEAWRPQLHPQTTSAAEDPRTPMSAALWPERYLLIDEWLAVVPNGGRTLEDVRDHMRRLDYYLSAKNAFLRRHIQSPRNNPGLEVFRRHFDALRPYQTNRTDRVLRLVLARWRDFAFDAQVLNHVELRISPCRSVMEYSRFLRSLEQVFRLVSRKAPRPGITGRSMPRFVVHFLRPRLGPADFSTGLNVDSLRTRLDREFTALREFIYGSDPIYDISGVKDLRPLIAGIDVANVESDTPIEYFSPYIKLIRGQKISVGTRELLSLGSPYLTNSARFYRDGYQNAQANRLGLTIHVGEDYYHPIIALREIWNSVIGCNMLAGDRLGHALALGVDIERFGRETGAHGTAPAGQMLDALVWADRRLGAIQDVDPRVARILADGIEELSRHIYRFNHKASDLYEGARLRQYPLGFKQYSDPNIQVQLGFRPSAGMSDPDLPDPALSIARDDAFDIETQARRATLRTVPVAANHPLVSCAFGQIQQMLTNVICERRIVIEMNPSSNRAIGGIDSMRNHPILKLKLSRRDLAVAVSCDDPGNFGTRIENEYALVLQGLRDLNLNRAEINEIVLDLIRTTYEAAFGRTAFSNEPGSWTAARDPVDFHETVKHDPAGAPD